MRSTLILVCLLFIVSNTNAQKLHGFIFCNTNDASIGTSADVNFAKMDGLLVFIADLMQVEYIPHHIRGNKFTLNNIASVVSNTKIERDDIVFQYLNSHGNIPVVSGQPQSRFPSIKIGNSLVSTEKLHQTLMKKKPKSGITIVEACSGFFQLGNQQSFLIEQNSSPVILDEIDEDLVRKKLHNIFESSCDIIISAGQPGVNTYATEAGSLFSNYFNKAFRERVLRRSTNLETWDAILIDARKRTTDATIVLQNKHYPIWQAVSCYSDAETGQNDDPLKWKPQSILVDSEPISYSRLDLKVCSRGTKKKASRVQQPSSTWPIVESNRREGLNYYYVTFSVIASKKVDSVVYFLHHTMPTPRVPLYNGSDSFYYRISVYGEFPVKAKVYFSDGTVEDVFNVIDFKKEDCDD